LPVTERKPLPPEGDPRRYVYVERLRCRDCGSPEHLRTYRSAGNGDGTCSRWTWCKLCGATFIAVLE
jgi:hypothetical protein